MHRTEKERVVKELAEAFADSGIAIILHYRGLNVAEMTGLRTRAREAGGTVRIAKNRLAKIALQGKHCEAISGLFAGPTAVAFSGEPIGIAKAVCGFAEDHEKLVVIGGAMGGVPLDANGVRRLAKLPSLDTIHAHLAGLLQAPAGRIVRTLAEPASQLARVLNARATSG